MNESSSSSKMIKNTEASGSRFNEEVAYDNYDANQYVAMDDLVADASENVATKDPDADDRDTDSEADAAPENADNAEIIYGNAKGKLIIKFMCVLLLMRHRFPSLLN